MTTIPPRDRPEPPVTWPPGTVIADDGRLARAYLVGDDPALMALTAANLRVGGSRQGKSSMAALLAAYAALTRQDGKR